MTDLSQSLQGIHRRMEAAAKAAGRAKGAALVAVSKGQSQAAVEAALKAGQRVFGENRVQEAKAKFGALRKAWPDLVLHLIGPLQTNKAEEAVLLFDVIETIDRPRAAEAVAKAIARLGKKPRLYIEVNTGREAQKAGVLPEDFEKFLTFCREECGLEIDGLMCIPRQGRDPAPISSALKNSPSATALSMSAWA